jgi:hypothetical protein
MPGDEVGLEEIYAEVDKRIKTAIDALEAKLTAEIAKKQSAKEPFKIMRRSGAAS